MSVAETLTSAAPNPAPSPAAALAGRFGAYGGRYVPETLMAALEELEAAYAVAQADPAFHAELDTLLRDYCGRPTPLYFAKRLSAHLGGAKIYLKREDLLHTGAHKINNALGQGLLARRMAKKRIIAETGAGQHGVAAATVCALLGLECCIYMGQEDMQRQEPNVYRMRLLGAEVRPVTAGSATLKDAISEAMRDWVTNVRTTFYILGSALGAHPYPTMVRDFQRVISREARQQILEAEGHAAEGRGCLRRRRFERYRRLLRVPSRTPTSLSLALRAEVVAPVSENTRRASRPMAAALPACCREPTPTCCRTRPGRSRAHTPSPPVSTMPRWARNTRCSTTPAAPPIPPRPITPRWTRSSCSPPHRRGSCRRSESAHAVAEAIRLAPSMLAQRHSDGQPVRTRGQGSWYPRSRTPFERSKPEIPASRHLEYPAGAPCLASETWPRPQDDCLSNSTLPQTESEPTACPLHFQTSLASSLISPRATQISQPPARSLWPAIDNGADVIELGVPFSDPLADGPVIQRASERAVGRGVRLIDVLQLAGELRKARPSAGLVLFSYLNPVVQLSA